jgi:hypothetical protein
VRPGIGTGTTAAVSGIPVPVPVVLTTTTTLVSVCMPVTVTAGRAVVVKGIVWRIVMEWVVGTGGAVVLLLFEVGRDGKGGRVVMVVVTVMVLGLGSGVRVVVVVPGRVTVMVVVMVVVMVSVAVGAMVGGVRVFGIGVGKVVVKGPAGTGKKGAKEVGVGIPGAVAMVVLGEFGVGMLAGWSWFG